VRESQQHDWHIQSRSIRDDFAIATPVLCRTHPMLGEILPNKNTFQYMLTPDSLIWGES